MSKQEYNLVWGESVCVRHAFTETLSGRPIIFGLSELNDMGYTKHEGDEQLIKLTHRVIKRQTGQEYRNILITNGASGAITISLRAFAKRGFNVAFTQNPPYFAIYPAMIESAGLKHVIEADTKADLDKPVALLDSPSNPRGYIIHGTDSIRLHMPVIWDAVYHNNIYTDGTLKPLDCDVLIGSYSKLTGLNGIRLGWIATNDDILYHRLKGLVEAEYCGLSGPSAKIINELTKNFYWDSFEQNARYKLNWNREEWSKLEKYFGDQPVRDIGMFYYCPIDDSAKRLLEKSNVLWTPGSKLGHGDDFGRFNLGQDNKLIQKAVKEILKNDKI